MLASAFALNVFGITLLFVGNLLVTKAVTKFNAAKNPRYVWGNRLQMVGFATSLAAILLMAL